MDGIRELGEWIRLNWPDVGMFLFTGVVARTAIVGILLNRRLVDAKLDPAVTVYIEFRRHFHSSFELDIKNAGCGGVRNVAFQIKSSPSDTVNYSSSRLMYMARTVYGSSLVGPLSRAQSAAPSHAKSRGTPAVNELRKLQPENLVRRYSFVLSSVEIRQQVKLCVRKDQVSVGAHRD